MPKDKSGSRGKIDYKDKFRQRYEQLTDWDEFTSCCETFLRRSIRVNTLKITVEEIKSRLEPDWNLTPIPWCREGFWIEHHEGRRDVGNLREHQLGYIYIQEAASMIPPLALEPKPGEIILDMCASPGSKSSQIAQYMEGKGILVCNDYKGMRMSPLGINLQRVGAVNSITTMMDGQRFGKAGQMFDRILVDAPCSGTGTIRKSLKTTRIWNPKMITRLSNTQKALLDTAYRVLKPGGTMVYSTCSCEPEENEGVVSFILNKYDDIEACEIDLDIKRSKIIEGFDGARYHEGVRKALRIWPQENDTEGFFVSKLRKKG